MKRNFTLMELVVAIFVVIVLVLLTNTLLSTAHPASEKARRVSCASNIKVIGLALKQYAMDNDDKFPHLHGDAGLDMLRKQGYLEDYKIYACPSTSNTGKDEDGNFRSSYVFRGGMSEEDPADSAIVWDKPNNHEDYGNILFLDGHVSGYAGANWMENIK